MSDEDRQTADSLIVAARAEDTTGKSFFKILDKKLEAVALQAADPRLSDNFLKNAVELRLIHDTTLASLRRASLEVLGVVPQDQWNNSWEDLGVRLFGRKAPPAATDLKCDLPDGQTVDPKKSLTDQPLEKLMLQCAPKGQSR